MTQHSTEQRRYRHIARMLQGPDVPDAVARMVRHAAESGVPVVLACAPELAWPLRAVLDGLPEVRVVAPPADTHPPEQVAALAALVDRELPPEGRLCLVTSADRPTGGWEACLQTDALLNHVLADRPVDHLCLFFPDRAAEGLGPEDVARATHPELLDETGPVPNAGYRQPADVLREVQRRERPDPLEATEPTLSLIDLDDMRTLRRAVQRALATTPLDPDAAQDFVLAIDEITANAAEHGVPPVDVQLWCAPDRMVCAITDRGTCFDDPLAGYGPAHGDMAVGGMGLWLARRSVDRLTATPADPSGAGCTVHLVVHAPAGQRAA